MKKNFLYKMLLVLTLKSHQRAKEGSQIDTLNLIPAKKKSPSHNFISYSCTYCIKINLTHLNNCIM